MAEHTVFKRSAHGSKIRSPLGAFVAKVQQGLEIFTVPILLIDGEVYQVTGEFFGSSQGSGQLIVGDLPAGGNEAVQAVSVWSDTSITFTFAAAVDFPSDGILWITVVSDSGDSDQKASYIGGMSDTFNMNNIPIGHGGSALTCGYESGGQFCTTRLDFNTHVYGYRTELGGIVPNDGYFHNTPGFYLVGEDSAKVVEFGPYTTSTNNTSSSPQHSVTAFCGVEGLAAFFGVGLSGDSPGTAQFHILYEEVDVADACVSNQGWTTSENIFLVPKYPVSIYVQTEDNAQFSVNDTAALSAIAYDLSGPISSSIAWSSNQDGSLGSGASINASLTTVGNHTITASVQNAEGEYRHDQISVSVEALSITFVSPNVGDEAGGDSVTVTGTGFTGTTTVEFDGALADNIAFVDIHTITCDTPAGSAGTVDVEVLDSGDSDTLIGGFTYQVASGLTITNVSPSSGSSAGGDTVTVTGTGFNADCIFLFGPYGPGSNVNLINATTAEVDTPAGSAGAVDVSVLDQVVFEFDTLINGYTYT